MGRPICQASSGAIASRIESIASTALERVLPRSATGTRFHSACALRATAIAAAISAADAPARRTPSRPSMGEMQTMSGIRTPLSSRKPRSGYPGPIYPLAQRVLKRGSRVSLRSPGMTAAFASIPLEPAHQLPVGHAPVVFELLPPGCVDVMIDHLIPECRAQHFRFVERLGRVAQGLRHLGQFLAVIGIARERRLERELLFDALEASGDQRREREIGIEVRPADAALDAD